MQREIKKYLSDILNCITNIENFTGATEYSDYLNNMMLQQAIERNLEIIGEAMSCILKIDNDINITDARKMVDTRNKLIHSYDQIRPSIIWNIIINHLPVLKQEVQQFLEN
jgi:uncharacterized protein with HEPN domain